MHSADGQTLTHGAGFCVSRDNVLTSTLISRFKAVLVGLLCFSGFAAILVLDWLQTFSMNHWFNLVADLSMPLLLLGLVSIGLYKRIRVSPLANRIWQEAGWMGLSISPNHTSQWQLDRFDRIIIQRTNWLGMDAPALGNPHAGKTGIMFRVKLMGDHELTVNSYANYQHALQLAHALAGITGYPIRDIA